MNHETRAQQAADAILYMIRNKGLQPGDKLPTESELMEQLGVGRNSLREALRLLMSRNVVTIRQGSGTFLSEKRGVADDPLGFSMMDNQEQLTRDLLQIRLILEPSIAELAAENATDADIRSLEEILIRMEDAIRNREDFHSLDAAFHSALAECTHNLVMQNLLPVITGGVTTFAQATSREYDLTIITHRRIYAAVRDHRPFAARQAMEYHLLYNEARYLQDRSSLN